MGHPLLRHSPHGTSWHWAEQLASLPSREELQIPKGASLLQSRELSLRSHIVVQGALKSSVLSAGGDETTLAFHFPSELVALPNSSAGSGCLEIVALADTRVCAFSLDDLMADPRILRTVRSRVMHALLQRVHDDSDHIASMTRPRAVDRVGMFLVSLHDRTARSERVPDWLMLPMSRMDIANYLGLVIETVSRSFTKLAASGMIAVEGRGVRYLDLPRLRRMCEGGARDMA
ncbi:Crp/Fnr family transcriptional regulator [Pseudoxanthomonas mexicana]|jgi:CRP/FNR family transcriptional regulator|uniref:Crp/Fnr family transcriptional regulator n=1 Tax=Pseudoxanthomonas mexicana TaxID=128785 RepID=UPI000ADA0B76|nr:Crp/Fnr family transcriptional regulator [Pseudoxanthomonas mexicana]